PAPQTELLKALHATGKPVVFINCSGSAIAMPWAVANLPAILQAWYPGEAGGQAVADVPFGHGLSYTRFKYGKPRLSSTKVPAEGTLHLSFVIKNTGSRDGDEVAQVY